MGKKRRILLAALVVAILGGIAWRLMVPPEPAYGGKPLRAWLSQYTQASLNWPRTNTPTDDAIRHMGTNAFPMITARLRSHDSALKVKLIKFVRAHPHLHFPFRFRTQNENNVQAVAALCALGPHAKPLIPTLAEALGHMDFSARVPAEFWLTSLGSEGDAAVPTLIQMLKDKTDRMRPFTVQTLAAVGGKQTNLVLPVLEECLHDSSAAVRMQATNEFSRDPWIDLNAMDHPGLTRRNR